MATDGNEHNVRKRTQFHVSDHILARKHVPWGIAMSRTRQSQDSHNGANHIPPTPDEDEPFRQVPPSRKNAESAYSVQNFLWLIASVAVFYYTDLLRTFIYDPRIDRFWFNIGVLLIGLNVSIGAFLIVFLSYVKKVESDAWDQHYPAAIPVATASFAFGTCCLTTGLWPLWGLLTPFILFTELMGVVVVIAMLPAF